MNAQKTIVSDNVVQSSIKPDKLSWTLNKQGAKGLQSHLLLIHELSKEFPNSGSVNKALDKFYNNRVEKLSKTKESIPVLISILMDIAFRNPRTYPIVSAILSKFLTLLDSDDARNNIINSITKRFDKIPNTGHIQLWLQRVVLKTDRMRIFDEKLCKKVNDPAIAIWNSDWLKTDFKTAIESQVIISEEIIDEIDEIIGSEEVQLFDSKSSY
ncbi:MAG: hypothetical protein HN916_17440 [Anaerolineae bacterium]|nr:hypothetical protein [Anaerolineae bacterium]MBT7989516.1 hypothetical protein [Anaerolineae bacterium]